MLQRVQDHFSAHRIFPTTASNEEHENYWSTVPFILLTLISWIRGVIHALSPDGGAESITGIRLVEFSLDARDVIIGLFTLWGWGQILFTFIAGIVILKYRSLIPFFWILYWLEVLGRGVFAAHKPVITTLASSGAVENVLSIILIPVFFLLSTKTPPNPSPVSSLTNEPMEIAEISSSAQSSTSMVDFEFR